MIALNCENLSLSFGTDVILDGISFAMNEGDKLGIVGVNGAGKSTLFSLIMGKQEPSGGTVYRAKNTTVGLLEQTVSYESSLTIIEEAYHTFSDLITLEEKLEKARCLAELSKSEEDANRFSRLQEEFTQRGGYEFRGRCRGILKNLGLTEDDWCRPTVSLSGGQKTRLQLACLLLRDPDILMLDEPTNHLDFASLFWLENYLKQSRKTILIISHDRYFLDAVASDILEIEHHRGKVYHGNYSDYICQKAKDREIEQRHYDNQQKEIKRIEAYIEQQRRWNRERNIIAAESRQKLLDKMVRLDRPSALPDKVRMSFEKSGESGNDVMTLVNLEKSYPPRTLFRDVSLVVKKHDRMFICGENGCGKSTLIKILAGRIMADGGFVVNGCQVKVGYYDQENQDLHANLTVFSEMRNAYPQKTDTELRSALALFLFKGEDVDKPIAILSGGEKARLTLCRLMLSRMNVLILDEPTNHLDIPSRETLESALMDFDGTLIAVSHDRYFINKLANRILAFGKGKSAHLIDFHGTYPEYLAYEKACQSDEDNTDSEKEQTAAKEDYLAKKKNQSEQRKQEKKLQKAKEEVKAIETRLSEIAAEIEGEAAYDAERLSSLSAEQEQAEEKLMELYELIDAFEGL